MRCAVLTFFYLAASSLPAFAYPSPHPSLLNSHHEVLALRANTQVDPAAVTGTKCTNKGTIDFHDMNEAEVSICGGIAGKIEKCQGNPPTTTGTHGTAMFTLHTITKGATIHISKGRWEGCVRAAYAVCPSGGFSSTCIGGATAGNVAFTLAQAET